MPETTCEKVGYESRSAAQAAFVRLLRVGKRKKGRPQVYACAMCGRFHWGHRRPRPVRQKRPREFLREEIIL